MAIPSRQIGWGTESNLLWQILKQLTRLTSTLFSLKEAATPKYKVFTALLTQSGGDNPSLVYWDEHLIKGVTYEIISLAVGDDVTQYGAPNNNAGTKFVSNQDVNVWGSSGSELAYNTGAPVVTVLENTIGNIWFTYSEVGNYSANSDGLFTADKSIILSIPNQYVESPSDLYNYQAYNTGIDSFSLNSFMNYLLEDGLYGSYAQNTIEIRVYN